MNDYVFQADAALVALAKKEWSYDGINYVEGKWYFWDETGSVGGGPYDSREDADAGLAYYAKTQLAPREEKQNA